MSSDLKTELSVLTDKYQNGFALPREFYTREDIYENDIKSYWNNSWIWVGHVSQVAQTGDFFLFDYGKESVIIVRDSSHQVHAYLNVCRHRGSRVCIAQQGTARVFSCPYHAWTYDLKGKLRGGREMGPDFDPAQYGLFEAHVRVFEGLIFICTSDTPPEIDQGLAQLRPLVAAFQLKDLKIAHTASYRVPANWKLAIENYMECYHCAPSHKEYSRSHSLKDPNSMTEELVGAMHAKAAKAGLKTAELNLPEDGQSGMNFYFRRYPLYPGYVTGSKDGTPVAPLLGSLTDYDGGTTDMQVGILNNFLIYSDHIVGYRFVPTALQETDIQVVWMVRSDARQDQDYDLDTLIWLWHVTSLDDERIIRVNQEGVNSHHFIPGPLSRMEWGIEAFYDNYLNTIAPKD